MFHESFNLSSKRWKVLSVYVFLHVDAWCDVLVHRISAWQLMGRMRQSWSVELKQPPLLELGTVPTSEEQDADVGPPPLERNTVLKIAGLACDAESLHPGLAGLLMDTGHDDDVSLLLQQFDLLRPYKPAIHMLPLLAIGLLFSFLSFPALWALHTFSQDMLLPILFRRFGSVPKHQRARVTRQWPRFDPLSLEKLSKKQILFNRYRQTFLQISCLDGTWGWLALWSYCFKKSSSIPTGHFDREKNEGNNVLVSETQVMTAVFCRQPAAVRKQRLPCCEASSQTENGEAVACNWLPSTRDQLENSTMPKTDSKGKQHSRHLLLAHEHLLPSFFFCFFFRSVCFVLILEHFFNTKMWNGRL